MSNVNISRELFTALCEYHLLDYHDGEEAIKTALEAKLAALVRHQHYTDMMTAQSDNDRETALRKYLQDRR